MGFEGGLSPHPRVQGVVASLAHRPAPGDQRDWGRLQGCCLSHLLPHPECAGWRAVHRVLCWYEVGSACVQGSAVHSSREGLDSFATDEDTEVQGGEGRCPDPRGGTCSTVTAPLPTVIGPPTSQVLPELAE